MTAVTQGFGVSPEAKYLQKKEREAWGEFCNSDSIGKAPLFRELAEVFEECREEGWNGYDAVPLDEGALNAAKEFLDSLPLGLPLPSLFGDPEGLVGFEWYQSRWRTLSVLVGKDGKLYFSALLGGPGSVVDGTEVFSGEFPRILRDLVERVFGS